MRFKQSAVLMLMLFGLAAGAAQSQEAAAPEPDALGLKPASLPAALKRLLSRGTRSARVMTSGAEAGNVLLHLYTVPGRRGGRAGYLDMFNRVRGARGTAFRRVQHLPLPDTRAADPEYSPRGLWLEPGRKKGPVLLLPTHDYDVLVTFPTGFSGPARIQEFEASASSIVAVHYSFGGVDERGFLAVTQHVSENGDPPPPPTTTQLRWDGKRYGPPEP